MLEKISKYLLFGHRFCGVEHTTKNGDEIISVTILNQSKKELLTEACFEERNIQDLSNVLTKNQHITLVINNNKVLYKSIENQQQDPLKLVYKAFPNIKLEDFYFEILSQKSKHFIALCRKDYVKKLIEEYHRQKLYVLDISLGNNLSGSISNFIIEKQIFSSNALIKLESNLVTQIEKDNINSEIYNINGLVVSNDYLLSFSAALKTVLKNDVTKDNFLSEKDRLYNSYKQTRFFNAFFKIGGLLILSLLLANFFFFNYYFNKVNDLKQVSEINLSTKTQIVQLNEIVSKKQKMVDDLLKNNGSKSSFYCNSIIHNLPNSVLLSELNYQPLLKQIKSEKHIELEENRIFISGISNNSKAFSNWISSLEQEDWIDKVVTIDYGTIYSNTSDFQIKIILGNE